MKTKSKLLFAAMAALLFIAIIPASGQDYKGKDGKDNWGDRMRAEKVAFLTQEMDLSPAEAEKFWPVYNEMEQARKKDTHKSFEAYRALDEAIKAGKNGKEVKTLLDDYMDALQKTHDAEAKYVDKLSEVISVEKIAKMFIGEENFRRAQICRWHGRNNGPVPGPQEGKTDKKQ